MRLLAALIVPLVIAIAPIAQAQRARRVSGSGGAQYRALIREAVSEFDAGRWAEARALFRRAHELDPSARTLRGMGMCSFELREYVAAIREFTDALAERRRALTSGQRRQVEQLLARANDFVGRFTIRIVPADARLTIDGMPVEVSGEILLELGRHELRAERAGYRPLSRRLDVTGGERGTLELRLDPAPALALDAPTAPPAPPRQSLDLGVLPAALLAGAGAALAGGIGASIWLADRESEFGICQAAGADCLNRDTIATQRDASLVVTVTAFSLAAALGVAGGALLLAAGGGVDREDGGARIACAPGPASLACAARF
jgi:hypothetical protein